MKIKIQCTFTQPELDAIELALVERIDKLYVQAYIAGNTKEAANLERIWDKIAATATKED